MKKFQLLAALVMGLLICGGSIAIATASEATDSSDPEVAGLSGAPDPAVGAELKSRRTATSRTYELSDGKRLTRIYEAPVNYLAPDGEFRPVDERLSAGADGKIRNGPNAFDVVLPERLGADPVRLSAGEHWVSSRLIGHSSVEVELDGGQASYQTGHTGPIVEFTSLPSGVKENIEIGDLSQPSSFDFELRASDGLHPAMTEAGSIEFRDSDDSPVIVLPAPVMTDSTLRHPALSHDVQYKLRAQDDGGWVLTVEAGREWLEAEERTWPVKIDPTLLIQSPALDCSITKHAYYGEGHEGWGGCGSTGADWLRLAHYAGEWDQWYRTLLRFNTTDIPTNASVTAATIGLHSPWGAYNTSGLQLRRITRSWTNTVNWKKYSTSPVTGGNWTQYGGDFNSEGSEILTSEYGTQAGWWNFSKGLVPVVQGWVENYTLNNHGAMLKLRDDPRECADGPTGKVGCVSRDILFQTSAAPEQSKRPYLDVVYYPSAPSGSKVVLPVEGKRTARRLKLKASGISGTTGVTFQYRIGKTGAFKTMPASTVFDSEGKAVSWPIPTPGGSNVPVYFDTSAADPSLKENGGDIQVRALFEGGAGVAGYSTPVPVSINRSTGGTLDATTGVGPGSLNLLTGNFMVTRTDISIPVFGSALEFARTHSSRGMTGPAADTSVMGRGWVPSAPVEAAGGAEWQSVREVVASEAEKAEGLGDYALLTDLEGYEYAFEKTGANNFATPPEMEGWMLSRPTASELALTDLGGNRTVFSNAGTGNEYKPISVSQAGGAGNKTQFIYGFPEGGGKRLKMIIAPTPEGVTCNESTVETEVTPKCRWLKFFYTSATAWGAPASFKDRLYAINYIGPGTVAYTGLSMTRYEYDSSGRLIEQWNPSITPYLKEKYTYRGTGTYTTGQLATVTPPGQQPWTLEYAAMPGEFPEAGRLVKVKRPSLIASPNTAQTSIVYDVPISGASAPYDMSGGAIAQWGQQDIPTDATAIFPPDQVPSSEPPSSYLPATLYYLDAEGQLVNVATPSGAGSSAPSITTSEADERGNVLRELSAQNRLRALAAPNPAERSHELETKREFSADGVELLQEWGPLHQVRLESSGEFKPARAHKTILYEKDPAPPAGYPVSRLPILETTAASMSGEGKDADPRVVQTKYNWPLKKPTDVIVEPNDTSLKLTTHINYDLVSGLPIERSLPANPSGGDARTTKIVYYKAGVTGGGNCDLNAGYAGLPCKILPAAQPGTPGQPQLLVKQILAYSPLGQPKEIKESPGGGTSNVRTTTITYNAGRQTLVKQEGDGTAVPPVRTIYSSTTGLPTEQKFDCSAGCPGGDEQTLKTTYDTLGRPEEYLDADSNTSSVTYDLLGRPVTTSDGKGIQTRTYDPTSGLLVKLEDSAAGTFGASYDADGNLTERTLPNGMTATTTYDETDSPVHLKYQKTTGCSVECTWLDFGVEESIHGQWLRQSSNLSTQEYTYDKAGRLRLVKDTPQGGGCTTRSYSYDKDSNRTALVTRQPGVGGVCDIASSGTTQTYEYDKGDRLIGAGISYDNYGRITSLPSAYAGGSTLIGSYYVNDLVRSQTQNGLTNTYDLDAGLRQRMRTQSGSKSGSEIYHYAGGSDSPAWIDQGSKWSRSIVGIAGELIAIQDSSTGTTLQLSNLHGDVVATASLEASATKLLATFESDEFGNPKQSGPPKYGWLGGKQRRTELPSGVIQMGVRSYVPALGRFLTPDPILGGSANAYDYANQDPVNNVDLTGAACKRNNANKKDCAKAQRKAERGVRSEVRKLKARLQKARANRASGSTLGVEGVHFRLPWEKEATEAIGMATELLQDIDAATSCDAAQSAAGGGATWYGLKAAESASRVVRQAAGKFAARFGALAFALGIADLVGFC